MEIVKTTTITLEDSEVKEAIIFYLLSKDIKAANATVEIFLEAPVNIHLPMERS